MFPVGPYVDFHLKFADSDAFSLEEAANRREADVSDVVSYRLSVMRTVFIVSETSSAQKGGHLILRQYMWDFSGWSDLSAVK